MEKRRLYCTQGRKIIPGMGNPYRFAVKPFAHPRKFKKQPFLSHVLPFLQKAGSTYRSRQEYVQLSNRLKYQYHHAREYSVPTILLQATPFQRWTDFPEITQKDYQNPIQQTTLLRDHSLQTGLDRQHENNNGIQRRNTHRCYQIISTSHS